MSPRTLVFFGGNGHCAARLQAARAALGEEPAFRIAEIAYPGFEDRPRAASLEEMLETIGHQTSALLAAAEGPALVYATGIGALLALAVRVQPAPAPGPPLILQGPVLWGLRRRWLPRLLRLAPLRALAGRLFQTGVFQRRFWRTHLDLPWEAAARTGFFEGYARCPAFADLFRWVPASWLQWLEAQLVRHPEALQDVHVWWGGRDRVVGIGELRLTERVLGVHWPLRVFPAWGHYPMIDDPRGWVREVAEAFHQTRPLSAGRDSPEAAAP